MRNKRERGSVHSVIQYRPAIRRGVIEEEGELGEGCYANKIDDASVLECYAAMLRSVINSADKRGKGIAEDGAGGERK